MPKLTLSNLLLSLALHSFCLLVICNHAHQTWTECFDFKENISSLPKCLLGRKDKGMRIKKHHMIWHNFHTGRSGRVQHLAVKATSTTRITGNPWTQFVTPMLTIKLNLTDSVLAWFGYFRNIHSLLIGHETQNRENGKAGHNAGGTVQQAQVETVPARKTNAVLGMWKQLIQILAKVMLNLLANINHRPVNCFIFFWRNTWSCSITFYLKCSHSTFKCNQMCILYSAQETLTFSLAIQISCSYISFPVG